MRRTQILPKWGKISDSDFDSLLSENKLFWQYPVVTEKVFHSENKNFFRFPWATVIDGRKHSFRIIYNLLREKVNNLENETCCQHIHFRKLIPLFKSLNITTLHTPHKIIGEDEIDKIKIKACPLYAVNFEDSERNSLFKDKDFMNLKRKYLYSFRGGWNRWYMTDIRKKIFSIENRTDVLIQNSGEWHFEKAVYGGEQSIEGEYKKGSDIDSYNQMLLDSRYSLCPSGSGPNSIRFWECLACGSIPILLSDKLDLPEGEDWENSIVRIKESDINKIDEILKDISEEKEEMMRKNCLEIYNKIGLKMENLIPKMENLIPKILFTSFKIEKSKVIQNQLDKWKEKNPDFEIKYFSDKDVDNFFKKFEIEEASKSYFMLKNGVAKADFFRICYIYKYGGYWFDLDLEPVTLEQGSEIDFFDMGYKNVSYMLIGAVKNKKIFQILIETIGMNILNNLKSCGKDIIKITGPHVLQRILGNIFIGINFKDGKFPGYKIKIKYQKEDFLFNYSLIKTNTKTNFYKKLQKENNILHYGNYNYI